MICIYFLLVCGLSFCFLSGIFQHEIVFNCDEIQLIKCFSFVDYAFGVVPKNSVTNASHEDFSLIFSS